MTRMPNSIMTTAHHDIHHRRRTAYGNYFSKQSIRNHSNVIQAMVDRLCTMMRHISKTGKPVNLWDVYAAMTADITTAYCFPENYGLLDEPDCGIDLHEMYAGTLANAHMLKHFPFLQPLMLQLPQKVVTFLIPSLARAFQWKRKWTQQINDIETGTDVCKANIFPMLLDSDLPEYDKSVSRLMEDVEVILGGATITTTGALALATYYILSGQQVLKTLLDELANTIPESTRPLPLVELEKLEYLTATTMETLRISHGVLRRLQRISPDQPLQYQDKIIPPGTPVSISAIHVHNNTDHFLKPHIFKPEGWLPLKTEGRRLQKYLVAFGRGSRSCLGINFGYAELYMTLAGVFRNLGGSMKNVLS